MLSLHSRWEDFCHLYFLLILCTLKVNNFFLYTLTFAFDFKGGVQSKYHNKKLQSIGKKGQSIEEVNDLFWGYENDITTKMEAFSMFCICFYSHYSSIVHSLM